MGVAFRIVLYAKDERAAKGAADAAFSRIEALNQRLSDYLDDSELNRLPRRSANAKPTPVSSDLWRVIERASQLARQTDGAFDITVGPYTKLWRQARRRRELPGPSQLAAARRAVGYQFVRLDPVHQTVQLLNPNMQLDLGGIAKGYAADQALAVLGGHGIRRAFVDGSGDMALGDPPPGRKGWRIAVAPLAPDQKPDRMMMLANCGVATSGDLWQHVTINNVRYSHIVDPSTGLGLTTRSSVTVVAPDAMTADSLASALSVLGPEKGMRLVEKTNGVSALIVRATSADGVETFTSPDFPASKPSPK
jgi:thiamine biosynthesis lipoprotein